MELKVSDLSDSVVLHYGGELQQINANTFANSILILSKVIQEINNDVNHSHVLTINIEALGGGSFRAKIKKQIKSIKGLFEDYLPKESIIPIFISILAIVYTNNGGQTNNITISNSDVTFNCSGNKVIIPKEIYDESMKIYQKSYSIQQSLNQNFILLEEDPSITSFGIAPNLEDKESFYFHVDSTEFQSMIIEETPNESLKIIEENTDVTILKAVLQRNKRKWEFAWRGIKISAPIYDPEFFEKMEKREISFSQGDVFRAPAF